MKTKIIFSAILLMFSLGYAQQQDTTAPLYDLTRPRPKTTAQILTMTRMIEGSEVWNTETKTMWRYVNSVWADTGSSFDGAFSSLSGIPAGLSDGDDDTIADGTETKVTAGTRINVTGLGSTASPYQIGFDQTGLFTNPSITGVIRLLPVSGEPTVPTPARGDLYFDLVSEKLRYYKESTTQWLDVDENTGTDDQTATEVPIIDAGGYTATTNVEDYLAENRGLIANNIGDISGLDASKLEDVAGVITPTQLATNSVTTVKINAGAVTSDKLATGAAAGNLGTGQVQGYHLNANSIGESKLYATNAPVEGYILSYSSALENFTWIPAPTGSDTADTDLFKANYNTSKETIVTQGVDSLTVALSDRFTTGADKYKKQVLVTGGRLDLFPDTSDWASIPDRTKWVLETFSANDTISINPAGNITVFFDGQGANNAGYIHAKGDLLYLEKRLNELYVYAPSITAYTYSPPSSNLYNQSDAADPVNEGNSVGASWVASSLETFASTTDDTTNGTYSIKMIDNAGGSAYGNAVLTQTGFSAGTVNWSFDVRQVQGTQGIVEVFDGSTAGTLLATYNLADNSVVFESFSGSGTLTGNSLAVRIYTHFGDALISEVLFDNAVFTQ